MNELTVLAFQAKKDDPNHPDNKIAFTIDGHLCAIFGPEAHDIIGRAVEHMELNRIGAGRRSVPRKYWAHPMFAFIEPILAVSDLERISKRV